MIEIKNLKMSQVFEGEQQRVAVARAYAGSPALLLADEPTGNLDSKNGERIIDLLLKLHQNQGNILILVTHDMDLASRADRIITLWVKSGLILWNSVLPIKILKHLP